MENIKKDWILTKIARYFNLTRLKYWLISRQFGKQSNNAW